MSYEGILTISPYNFNVMCHVWIETLLTTVKKL
jgi:hypothetical protein